MRKYPKVRTVGHRDLARLLTGHVVVQEKVDGSNLSFGVDPTGRPFIWSRTQELTPLAPVKMFAEAVEAINPLFNLLKRGTTLRCEYLQKPKHNVLAYDRVPKKHLVLYDLEIYNSEADVWVMQDSRALLESTALMLGIDVVPEFYRGTFPSDFGLPALVETWHNKESFLGGPKIEGVVIKNYEQTDERSGAPYLVGKSVRAEFKEEHTHKIRLDKPEPASSIGARYGGPARWRKTLQYLTEMGAITGSMEDMPALMHRVREDVATEEADSIRNALYKTYEKKVLGATTKGLAEWYKQVLEDEFTDGGSGI